MHRRIQRPQALGDGDPERHVALDVHDIPPATPDGLDDFVDRDVVGSSEVVDAVMAIDDPCAGWQHEDDRPVFGIHVDTDQVGDQPFWLSNSAQ